MKTYTFHVNGMHCKSCEILTERELREVAEVSFAKADLGSLSVLVEGEFGDKSSEHVAKDLSEVLKPHGYSLSVERSKHDAKWKDFAYAVPIAALFIGLFILLQKLGIVNLVDASEVTYGTAFLIGLIASVSTCMAVVGGLVLSMSASFAKEGDKLKPQMLFHIGRLVSFFILGGVIGAIGTAFELGSTGIFALSFVVAIILLVLGINLLDIFPWMKRLQPTMPRFIGKRVHDLKNINHTITPLMVGIATFFLPCGFTQSMQIFTLTTGGFFEGAMTMFAFALGTLPVLAILSFSSVAIHKKTSSGVFFKTAGLVVLFFGIFNLVNSLVILGMIPPVFNF